MPQALAHTNKKVYAIDPDILLCTEEMHVQEAPSHLAQPHKQACKSMTSTSRTVTHAKQSLACTLENSVCCLVRHDLIFHVLALM
jgi:hypothetical protein